MRRDRDFRPPRHRGFDDDEFGSSRSFGYPPQQRDSAPRFSPTSTSSVPSGPPGRATVKWYNPEKGFGFVTLADGGGDAFLHASIVQRSGETAVAPGTTLEVRTGPGPKGPQVTEILSVDASTAMAEPPRRPRPDRPDRPAYGAIEEAATTEEFGTVKFYAPDRGFGFIERDRGGKDIFVHVTALNRSGLDKLDPGQRVGVDVTEGRKGPEAVRVRMI